MNSKEFSKGDILEATDRSRDGGFHKIIYYEVNSNSDFNGCMITHSDDKLNCKMSEEHFRHMDDNSNEYKFGFDNSYLVIAKFIKLEEWGPFKKVGCLTEEGIAFVESKVANLIEESFLEYVARNKQIN